MTMPAVLKGRPTAGIPLALSMEEVRPRYATEPWKVPLTLHVPTGAFVTLVTSPARAAALFRLILAFDEPVTGAMRVLGMSPHTFRRDKLRRFRRRIGSSLLPDGLMANASLRSNVVVPLVFGDGRSTAEANLRADEVLARFGLAAHTLQRPSDLAPDKRQIASLARAVAGQPELLLLHDPLRSLNNHETKRLLLLAREYSTTVIAAVHGEDDAVCRLADGVAMWDEQGYRELART